MPRCLIIAGPNGAGKTTFALEYLPAIGIQNFINADHIAAGLSPFRPDLQAVAAARLFLDRMESCIQAREDFAFETTLAGRGYLRLIDRLQAAGWTVDLYYIALPSIEMSKARVAERVEHGGHNIPAHDIERRFPRSLRNLFNDYRMRTRKCVCYLNDDASDPPLVFWNYGDECTIFDHRKFELLWNLAGLS
jgi:predicted ABC-type ATPase